MMDKEKEITKHEFEKVEKNLKMRRKVDNARTSKFGIEFGPFDFYIDNVEKGSSNEYIMLTLSAKDTTFLTTHDDRKVSDKNDKYSNIRIKYFKKEIDDIAVDFLRKGDIARISGKFAHGFEVINKEADIRKRLKENGKSDEFIEEFIISAKEIKSSKDIKDISLVDTYRTKMHYFGLEISGTSLTQETKDAIKDYQISIRKTVVVEKAKDNEAVPINNELTNKKNEIENSVASQAQVIETEKKETIKEEQKVNTDKPLEEKPKQVNTPITEVTLAEAKFEWN